MEGLVWRDVARRIELCMVHAGVRTIVDLARVTSLNRSTLSLKMSGVRRWQMHDLQTIATALNTSLAYLMGETEDRMPIAGRGADQDVAVPVAELQRRMGILGKPVPHHVADLMDAVDANGTVRIRADILDTLAVQCGVVSEYLLDFTKPEMARRIEAQIRFTAAAVTAGVRGVEQRSLSRMSTESFEALAKAMESAVRAGDPGSEPEAP